MRPKLPYRRFATLALSAACAGLATGCTRSPDDAEPRTHPLSRSVYVWQRVWDDALRDAVRDAAPTVDAFTVLAAEVSWTDRRPHTVLAPVDYPALAATGRPIGIALRIGPYPADISEQTAFIRDLAAALVKSARAAGVTPCELQLDFDCPDARLRAYARTLAAVRSGLDTTPLVVTALPSWLGRAGWRDVARACDAFVLQVHSVTEPGGGAPLRLCDPASARQWAQAASRVGRPFRIALPTYGYVAGFAENGRLVGLRADGSSAALPDAHRIELALADPLSMAALAREWHVHRPPQLEGLAWYRLPLPSDRLAWTWPTLRKAIDGSPMRRLVETSATPSEVGATHIAVHNRGDVDVSVADIGPVRVAWSRGAASGVDGLNGFRPRRLPESNVEFGPPIHAHLTLLKAGETMTVGWMRIDPEPAAGDIAVRLGGTLP